MGNPSCRDGGKVVILNGLIRVGIPEKMRSDDKLKEESAVQIGQLQLGFRVAFWELTRQ